jgi:hypothetical protein
MARYLFTFFAITCAASAMGAVYKWVDPQGVTHYSETPPQGTEAREVRILGGPSTGSEPAAPSQPAPVTSEADQKQAADRKTWCEIAKRNILALEADAPAVTLNEAGEEVPIDDEQRAKALADAKRRVKQYCAPE